MEQIKTVKYQPAQIEKENLELLLVIVACVCPKKYLL